LNGEKWSHCYGNKFAGISSREINCAIFNTIFWKKKFFFHHQFVNTETRRKQPMPNNFGLKMFHFNLKRTAAFYACWGS